jgi:amino acid transporter
MTHNTPDPEAWEAIVALALLGLFLGGIVALFVDFFANTKPALPTHPPSPPTVVRVERDPGADMIAGLLLGGFLAACFASLAKKPEHKGEGKDGGRHG